MSRKTAGAIIYLSEQMAEPVDSRQSCALEITLEMIEAGTIEAREHPLGASLEELVRKVFIAMRLEQSD